MKIQIPSALCALVLLISTMPADAQMQPSGGMAPTAGVMHNQHSNGRFREALEQLNLSADQKEKIRQIRHDAGMERKAGRPEGGRMIRQKIEGVLRPDQLEKLRAILKRDR